MFGGEVCKTRDEAAQLAAEAFFEKSARFGVEYGTEIVSVEGGFQYATPRAGLKRYFRVKTGRRGYAGFVHTHAPGESDNFSPEDKGIADRTVQPAYLVTPGGDIKRYDSDPGKEPDDGVEVIGKVGGKQ